MLLLTKSNSKWYLGTTTHYTFTEISGEDVGTVALRCNILAKCESLDRVLVAALGEGEPVLVYGPLNDEEIREVSEFFKDVEREVIVDCWSDAADAA